MDFRQTLLPTLSSTFSSTLPLPGVRSIAVCAMAVALTSGCTAHHHSATQTPAPTSDSLPAKQLAAIATVAEAAEYDAIYSAHSDAQSGQPARTNIIKVYRTPTRTRLDVDEQDTHVLIQVDATGTSSCTITTGVGSACVLLAGPGSSVPADVPDPGLQHTFTSTLKALASSSDLRIKATQAIPAENGLPAASCFVVTDAPVTNAPGTNAAANDAATQSPPAGASAPAGTYCFSAAGIMVRVRFQSSVLQLTSIGEQPVASNFQLPAAPVPVKRPTPSATPAS